MEAGVSTEVEAVATLEHDAQLMLRVKEGDDLSFELLLEKYRSSVISYLYRMVQNQAVAEELAQEVFFRVYRSRTSYEPTAKFTTWLFRIATHLALNSLRDHRSERNQESLDEEVENSRGIQVRDQRTNREQELVADARLEEVRRAVAMLPEKQRAAVLMHKYQEMDYVQISSVLGCSTSAVKSLLFRAYETLRFRLRHLGGQPVQEGL
jgi:RNA polymerase sigma-70 factor (ECF subfamily)